jgi:hypothetical protein
VEDWGQLTGCVFGREELWSGRGEEGFVMCRPLERVGLGKRREGRMLEDGAKGIKPW